MSEIKKQSSNSARFLMGTETIAQGVIESGCSLATAYPATHSSEVMESLTFWKKELKDPICFPRSINEKVAYGAILAGDRSVVVMEIVGLNVASDPLLSVVYWSLRVGLVVLVASRFVQARAVKTNSNKVVATIGHSTFFTR